MSNWTDGYTELGDLDEPGLGYEFNTLRAYRRKSDGALFFATDAGCSCPMPFENTTESDLIPWSADAVRRWASGFLANAETFIRDIEEGSDA